MSFLIRRELPGDVAVIEAVTIAAFATAVHSNGREQDIVARLRQRGELACSLVADASGSVIGHAAASPVSISDGSGGWFGLAPVSVLPAHQRRGAGGALIRAILTDLKQAGAQGCVVLGEPDYYGRFGFTCRAELILPGVPPEYFQALSFRGDGAQGQVAYSPAFVE